MSSYSKFYQFGTAMNANVKNPLDQSNPLTYCITPTFNFYRLDCQIWHLPDDALRYLSDPPD